MAEEQLPLAFPLHLFQGRSSHERFTLLRVLHRVREQSQELHHQRAYHHLVIIIMIALQHCSIAEKVEDKDKDGLEGCLTMIHGTVRYGT